jgi:hypothetical protein
LRYSKIGKFIRQYQKFIQPGAIRVEASTNDPGFDPLAFRNPSGHYVVVVRTRERGDFRITGLPAGTYGIQYTTDDQLGADLTDMDLRAGGMLKTSIPATGVITVYGKGKLVLPTK